jgi:hypothetical protein
MTAKELSSRTGVSLEDITTFERIRLVHPIQKGKKKVFEEDDILIIECYGKLRKAGYTKDLGFDPSVLLIHKEALERLVAEEAKFLAHRVTGKLDIKEVIRMVEEGTAIGNTMISVIRKKLIVETVRRYAAEFQDKVMMRPFR